MKVINILVLFFILFVGPSYLFSQNEDQVNTWEHEYKNYYKTKVKAISNSGKYVVVKNSNQYGKDEHVLIDTNRGIKNTLSKGNQYNFLSEDQLLILGGEEFSFYNIRTKKARVYSGKGVLISLKGYMIMYFIKEQEIRVYHHSGQHLKTIDDIAMYSFDETTNTLAYLRNGTTSLYIQELGSLESVPYTYPTTDVLWLGLYGDMVYYIGKIDNQHQLHKIHLKNKTHQSFPLNDVADFTIDFLSKSYIEIREGRYLLLPCLKIKDPVEKNEQISPIITYSIEHNQIKYKNKYQHLAIFDIERKDWIYRPSKENKVPKIHFLNEKGDFLVFDKSEDTIESESNPHLNVFMNKDYGSKMRILGPLPSDTFSYYWNEQLKRLLYFKDKHWWCYHFENDEHHEIMQIANEDFLSSSNSGLTGVPFDKIYPSIDKSKVYIRSKNVIYLYNIKNHHYEVVLNGSIGKSWCDLKYLKNNEMIKGWGIGSGSFELKDNSNKKPLYISLYSNLSSDIYRIDNKDLIKYEIAGFVDEIIEQNNNVFFTVESLNSPVKVYSLRNGTMRLIFDQSHYEEVKRPSLHYETFLSQTSLRPTKNILIYPYQYDSTKKYPMIVYVYENQTKEAEKYVIPHSMSNVGFDFMHYAFNGYFVLLPDLFYNVGYLKESVLYGLTNSVKSALPKANIDSEKVGIIGLSFGGYETATALTGTSLFATGVSGVMVSDFVSLALSSTKSVASPNYMRLESHQLRMGVSLFDDYHSYVRQSPIYDLKNLTKPLLLWLGKNDENVPPSQTRSYFYGIKRLNKKSIMLEYPGETHNIFKRQNVIDLNRRIWEWFEYYLKGSEPTEWIKPIL